MRRELASALVATSLILATTGAAAQDEDLRMGDDPAYWERVEVPEAGIAAAFPSDWDITVEMTYHQHQAGDPYSGYWFVVRAGDGERSCSLEWELYPTSSAAELATIDLEAMAEIADEMMGFEVAEVELPTGIAYRTDYYEPDLGGYSSIYEIGSEGTSYQLLCSSDVRDPGDWIDIATRLELLPTETRLELPLDPPSEVRIAYSPDRYALEWTEVPAAGIAMSLPPDWQLEVMMEERELELPPDLAEVGPVLYEYALYTEGESGDWCGLQIHGSSPLTRGEHADLLEAEYAADPPDGIHVHGGLSLVGDDIAYTVDILSDTNRGVARDYVYDLDSTRYVLTCGSDVVDNPAWRDMAGSIEPIESLETEPVDEPEDDIDFEGLIDFDVLELEWADVREAGVSLLLRPEWSIDVRMERQEFELPDDYAEAGPASFLDAFTAETDSGEFCVLHIHDQNPMTLDDHSAWDQASWAAAFPDVTIERYQPDLWTEPGYAITVRTPGVDDGATIYLFEIDGLRYELQCAGPFTLSGVADAIAGSLTPFEPPPAGVPEDAVGWWESGPFTSLVNVSDSAVMRATCERALWIEYDDGTYEERIDCLLSDDPVDPSDSQGSVPAETVVMEGGACEWVSDFWLAEDGSEVWAGSWSTTIEPDGVVTGTSTYGAHELECEEG